MVGDTILVGKSHRKAARQITKLLLPRIEAFDGRFIITLAGETGAGKSEICTVIHDLLTKQSIPSVIIQQDDYFVLPPKTNAEMRRQNIAQVGTLEVNLDLLDRNLKEIMEGADRIEKPLVEFANNEIGKETVDLRQVKVVIVDGTYTTLLKNTHQHVFVDLTYLETREARERRAREDQDDFLERILDIEHGIISSHKPHADIIVTSDYRAMENHVASAR